MKKFLLLAILGLPVTVLGSNRLVSISKDYITIELDGIQDTVEVLHISDSHITILDDEDKPYMKYADRMSRAYINTKHFQTYEPTTGSEVLSRQMEYAGEKGVDMIALTGDIINYPSASMVGFVRDRVAKTGIPYIYTAGNHDWHLEGMAGSSDELRDEWCNKILKPLYSNGNYKYSSRIIGGVNFVAIDNSTYQIKREQLDFFLEQCDKKLPVVLLMHIPIYTPTSAGMNMGNPEWGCDSDTSYKIERRERWAKEGNSRYTIDFVDKVTSLPGIVVLCGHTHREHINLYRNMIQITAESSRNGTCKVIRFIPKSM